MSDAYAVWLTGLPGAGKSAIARELLKQLRERGAVPAILESDVMRTQLTPCPVYDEDERQLFYGALIELGEFLVRNGRPVVFDATANRRRYRDAARERIGRFAEVLVDTPQHICVARDPKGLYRAAREGRAPNLPGPQAAYEPPLNPDLSVCGANGTPGDAAQAIVALLEARRWI